LIVPFVIGQGDLSPVLIAILSDANGLYSLSGATVRFHMVNRWTHALVINALATPDPDQIGRKGQVSYTWQLGDTDVAGDYDGEFRILIGGIIPETFPNDDNKIAISITPALTMP
jgi:hypothetical protein